MKLLVDINDVKICHYEEDRCGRFRHALTDPLSFSRSSSKVDWLSFYTIRRQPLDNFELYNSLKLSFANIKDLRSNFVGCESFFESNSPDILVLCETNLDGSIDSGIFLCDRLSSFNLERFYNSVLQLM